MINYLILIIVFIILWSESGLYLLQALGCPHSQSGKVTLSRVNGDNFRKKIIRAKARVRVDIGAQ